MRSPPLAVIRTAALVLVALAALSAAATAQFGYFGQNKVQYRRFDWRGVRRGHTGPHFFPRKEESAPGGPGYAAGGDSGPGPGLYPTPAGRRSPVISPPPPRLRPNHNP